MKKALFILLLAAATGCHKAEDSASIAGPEVGVRFVLPGLSADASPASRADGDAAATTPETENLAEDVTVRVLAFQRRDGGASADISADTFVAEATYKALADGSLVACNVDASGAVDAANTATPAEIRLRADTYDFYALTPAVAVASPWEVSIDHGVDHAASVKEAVPVGPTYVNATTHKQPVQLTPLDRKCAKISFSFDRKADSESTIKKLIVSKVELSQIAHAPSAASKLCAPLSIGVNDGMHAFPTGKVVYDDSTTPSTVDHFDCFDEVLPKAAGEYKLLLNVYFNPKTDDPASETPAKQPSVLEATISATNPAGNSVLAFVPGYHYNFKIVLKGNEFTLYLQVGDWDLAPDWGTDVGGWPAASIIVGQWTVEDSWETDLGGGLVPVITVGGWTSNPSENWGSDMGSFPMLNGVQVGDQWTSSGDDLNTDLGNETVPSLTVGDQWAPGNADSGFSLGEY